MRWAVAPAGREIFFEQLLQIKNRLYGRRFQLQFSIHSTDPAERSRLVPVEKWSLEAIAQYGNSFFREGERKVTLNFALAEGVEVDPEMLRSLFDPGRFLIKITPVNPTYQALRNGIASHVVSDSTDCDIVRRLRDLGFDVILSIGELEENRIGSNCGQHMTHYFEETRRLRDSYTYPIVGRQQAPDSAL